MKPIEIALAEYGTQEVVGFFNSPRVLQYFRDIGASWVRDDETAWCAAFVQWVLKQSGKNFSSALNARSFLDYGTPTDKPKVGDIVIFWRIAKDSPYGHVGFYISEDKNNIYVLGGNQNNMVNISAYSKANVLGYRTIV